MEVCISIEKYRKEEIFYISKKINGIELWLNRKKELSRFKGERACVREWKRVVQLLDQILRGDIS